MYFKKNILNEKANKRFVLVSAVAALMQIVLFKIVYVFPNFISDSQIHLVAAFNNQQVSSLPIGYSKFLRFFSGITSSHILLVVFQYLFLQAALMYFLLTIKLLFTIGKRTFWFIAIISVLNPMLLYVSNMISSDALFTGLSIIWFTQLLWIIYQPTLKLLLLHTCILLLAFMFKYSALYYPFISIPVIIFSQAKYKLASISLTVLLLGWFIGNTQNEFKKITGQALFMPAMGWNLAGNALHAYEYLPLDSNENIAYYYKGLQATMVRYVDSLNEMEKYLHSRLNYNYQYDKRSVLYTYMRNSQSTDTLASPLQLWAKASHLYKKYGLHLINKNPEAYFQYFIKPNLVYFYAPKPEFMSRYNAGIDTLDKIATSWFNLKNNKIADKKNQLIIPELFPIASAIVNILFLVSVLGFLTLKGFAKTTKAQSYIITLVLVLWICNFLFSILSAPIVVRHQLFPLITTFLFTTILMSYIIKEARVQPISLTLKTRKYRIN